MDDLFEAMSILKGILTKLKTKLERDNYVMKNEYNQWITMSALIDGILDFVETGDEFQLSQLLGSLNPKPSVTRDIKIDMKLGDKYSWTE